MKEKGMVGRSISDIPQIIQTWKAEARSASVAMEQLYDLQEDTVTMTMTPQVQENVLKMFNTTNTSVLEALQQQTILSIYNVWSLEEAVYNPARSKRPGVADRNTEEPAIVDEMAQESQKTCVFCQYESFTSIDPVGRLHSAHSVTCANTFPFAGSHAMVLLDTHHPTNISMEQVMDMFQLAFTWFDKMSAVVESERYGMMVWDSAPRAGASQLHPHMHMTLSTKRYPGQLDVMRQASLRYHDKYPSCDYFTDIQLVHQQLGLAVKHGQATAFASITPKKDYEVFVISSSPCQDFFELIYFVTRVFVCELGQSAFSMGMALPHGDVPAVARLLPRGPVSSRVSDISSLDLFTSPSIAGNPYHVISLLDKMLSTTACQDPTGDSTDAKVAMQQHNI